MDLQSSPLTEGRAWRLVRLGAVLFLLLAGVLLAVSLPTHAQSGWSPVTDALRQLL
jgi:hypothetical protein